MIAISSKTNVNKKLPIIVTSSIFVILCSLYVIYSYNEHTPSKVVTGVNNQICREKFKVNTKNETDTFKVPNIVHYNWYATKRSTFQFKHWISVLSAYKYIKPEKIFIHYNEEPEGIYWNRIIEIPSVEPLKEKVPDSLLGQKVGKSSYFTHPSNIGRIAALLKTGGIYMDFDVVVIQSFDELRKYQCTIGYEWHDRPCGGIIICAKDSPFLYLWANAYLDDFKPETWAYNTGVKPGQLAERFPNLIHREMTRLNRPSWDNNELHKIWGDRTWNWHENLAVHTWYRDGKAIRDSMDPPVPVPTIDNIWTMNNTYAEISRFILTTTCNVTGTSHQNISC